MKTPAHLRWPKGPFPERYRFAAVEARLEARWGDREQALRSLTSGLTPFGPDDPWVRLFLEPPTLSASDRRTLSRRAREEAMTVFAWVAPRRERREGAPQPAVLGFVPATDPPDAVSAVGVAGLAHGIGLAAIVRFLAALPAFAPFEIARMGEDYLALSLTPKSDEALLRVAYRARLVCPPLAEEEDITRLVEALRTTGSLVMDWA